MVIDNLEHLRLFHSVYSLILLIMIHKDDLLLPYIQETSSGDKSEEFTFIVDNGEIPKSSACHDIFDIIHIIPHLKCDQILLCHKIFHRNTLVDMLCRRKCIVGRPYDHYLLFLCLFNDLI